MSMNMIPRVDGMLSFSSPATRTSMEIASSTGLSRMEKLLKLGLFLFSVEIVFLPEASAFQCRKCTAYIGGICQHQEQTCTARNGESCVTLRHRYSYPYNLTHPQYAETFCKKDCVYNEEPQEILITCCDYDFCNDLSEPVAMP
ncbi:uncharacterized protein LOC143644053 isoform X2 [Tamandua tetradactyla]|uniref:uncharacterized protein LOC143644053 isoform X2 n=1 Tax=Tamandua tetradactyla TaxID=48850 RepID=UPI0040540AC2